MSDDYDREPLFTYTASYTKASLHHERPHELKDRTPEGATFFFPREKVPSAFTVPPGTKFWLFFSYEGKSSLDAQNLKTLIPELFFKPQYHSYCTFRPLEAKFVPVSL